MSGFWILSGPMVLAVLAALLWPLTRRREEAGRRAAFDLKVYKDQLKEVDRDRDRGLLTDDQAAAARTEIERRMLKAVENREEEEAVAGRGGSTVARGVAMGGVVLAVALAIAFYFEAGSPYLPDQPLASRGLSAKSHASAASLSERLNAPDMRAAVARLAEKLSNNPNDIEGWTMLARSYVIMDRMDDAANAYEKAFEAAKEKDSDIAADYAEVLVARAGNVFTDDALRLFQKARALDPMNPKAIFYVALGKARRGDLAAALREWADLGALSPPDAPWMEAVRFQMARAAERLGVSLEGVRPSARALALAKANPDRLAPMGTSANEAESAMPGPTREDMDAAAEMSDSDRAAMIRSMVDGLAEKLGKNPDDLAGWKRLARAYEVLGETEKARAARSRIRRLTGR